MTECTDVIKKKKRKRERKKKEGGEIRPLNESAIDSNKWLEGAEMQSGRRGIVPLRARRGQDTSPDQSCAPLEAEVLCWTRFTKEQ